MIHIQLNGNDIYVDWYGGGRKIYGPFQEITLACPWCTHAKTVFADQIRDMFPIGKIVEGKCTKCKKPKGTQIYVESV